MVSPRRPGLQELLEATCGGIKGLCACGGVEGEPSDFRVLKAEVIVLNLLFPGLPDRFGIEFGDPRALQLYPGEAHRHIPVLGFSPLPGNISWG